MTRFKIHILLLIIFLNFTILPIGTAADAPVNVSVTNAEVRDVLTAIATVSNVNLVADDSVSGKITIQLRDIPFETALELVTKTKGLTYYKVGSTIVVGSSNQMGRNFGEIHVFKLQYAKPADVRDILVGMLFNEAAPKASTIDSKATGGTQVTTGNSSLNADRIKMDDSTNSIVFFGSPAEAEQVRKILSQIDIAYQQVSLEAQVVAINKNASKDLGVDWKWSSLPQYPEYEAPKITPIYDSSGNLLRYDVTEPGKFTRDKENMVGTIRFGSSPGGYPYEFYYSATISALVSKGEAQILAKPNITTMNGKKGHILIGDKIPVPKETTDNNKTTTTFEYQEAGIILDYTPRINNNGEITIDLKTSVSTPTLIPSLKAYQISTREAETYVRLKDGETMVIGGLIGKQESGGKNKVPFLGDLPVLGKLFQSVHTTKSETEVMIFLTARIVK